MKTRHRQELFEFQGTAAEKKRLRLQQQDEETRLDKEHFTQLATQLKSLLDSGIFDGIQIDLSSLSAGEKTKLLSQLADAQEIIGSMREEVADLKYSFEGQGTDLLGMSESDWKLFLENLSNGKFGFEEMMMTIKACMGAYAMYDKFLTNSENAQLKKDKKNNDKKKKNLQTRLNAGRISQKQYNAAVARADEEYDAKAEELQIKQAKRQKAMSISEAIINTALGATKALEWGWPLGPIFAALLIAQGMASVGLIASTPISTGAEEGGQVIERMQDGKKFNARYSPDKRGFISSPTVLVSENGKEYVVPAAAMDNPSLIPVLNTIEAARRQGTLGSFDFNAVYRQNTPVPGFVSGGPTGAIPSFDTTDTGLSSLDAGTAGKFIAAVDRLCDMLKNPILAYVTMLGENGIVAKMKEYNRTRERGQIGGKKR